MRRSKRSRLLIRLAEEFQTPIHVVHLSSAKALPILAGARKRGVPITVETCVHYLVVRRGRDSRWRDGVQMRAADPHAPPIARELWAALESGLIDLVATDHSPCPPAMKRREEGRWDLAWGGIASLGLALPVMWTAMQPARIQHGPGRSANRQMDGRRARASRRCLTAKKERWPSAPTPTSSSSIPTPPGP